MAANRWRFLEDEALVFRNGIRTTLCRRRQENDLSFGILRSACKPASDVFAYFQTYILMKNKYPPAANSNFHYCQSYNEKKSSRLPQEGNVKNANNFFYLIYVYTFLLHKSHYKQKTQKYVF